MSSSAFKKYLIGPQTSGDITSGFVTDSANLGGGPGSATITITYKRVGKLYFAFATSGIGFGSGVITDGQGDDNVTNAARVASLLGVTVGTIYNTSAPITFGGGTGARGVSWWNGSVDWIDGGTNSGEVLMAFLAT